MNAISSTKICTLILSKLGIHFSGSLSQGLLSLSPVGFHINEAFVISFNPGWRSAEASFAPGKFAGPTVRSMGEASENAKNLFAAYARGLNDIGVQVSMLVNNTAVSPTTPAEWPPVWSSLTINLKKSAIVFDLNKDPELLPIADMLLVPLTGMVAALIGFEEDEASANGAEDGKAVQYLATKYERKKLNREACIRAHGCTCKACGFDFGRVYGDLGAGYIEVHHIEPLSVSGPTLINPITDLVPLCSNCHTAVHRVSPPLPVEELRRLIHSRNQTPCLVS